MWKLLLCINSIRCMIRSRSLFLSFNGVEVTVFVMVTIRKNLPIGEDVVVLLEVSVFEQLTR